MKLRRLLIATATVVSLVATSNAFAASDEEFSLTWPVDSQNRPAVGYVGVNSNNVGLTMFFSSYLINFNGSMQSPTSINTCKAADDGTCNGAVQSARVDLQPCSTSNPTDCFAGITVTDANGKDVPVQSAQSKLNPGIQGFTGNQSLNLPTGGDPILVDIPGAAHASGSLYLIKPDLMMRRENGDAKFKLQRFESQIYPVKLVPVPSTDVPSQISTQLKDYSGNDVATDGSKTGGNHCNPMYLDDGKNCFVPEAFPEGFKFGLKYRLSNSINGWLHGRFANPDIQITTNPASKDGQDISFSAFPIRVPVIGGFVKQKDVPAKLLALFQNFPRIGSLMGGYNEAGQLVGTVNGLPDRNAPVENLTIAHDGFYMSQEAFDELAQWLPVMGDTAAAAPTMWYLQSMQDVQGKTGECSRNNKGLAGLVTTNATAYLPGPPAFDAALQTLDYKVLAPHFNKDKTVFQGSYNLTLGNAVARCIYGFSNAPIKASVSVTGADGQSSVATTVIREDKNFLYMAANGFTFSSPTVRVKLTQDPVAVVKAPVKQVKTTITCVKGKTVQKVSAISPKCPAGFKKK